MTHVNEDFNRFINDIEAYRNKEAEANAIGNEISQLLKIKPQARTLEDRLRINELRKKASNIDSEIREIAHRPMSIAQQLADRLHSNGCHKSHSDQCSYLYETNWTQSDHAKYLDRAIKIVNKIGEEETKRLLDLYDQKSGLSKEIDRIIGVINDLNTMTSNYP